MNSVSNGTAQTAQDNPDRPVYIVGIGGTTRDGSSTERAVRLSLEHAARLGAEVLHLAGRDLDFAAYRPEVSERTLEARRLIDEVRRADGIIIGTPGYHGGVSGLIKNAIDYLEDLRSDRRPYLDGRPVGCIVTAAGWQGAVSTVGAVHDIVHALRGWPTPFSAPINTAEPVFTKDGACSNPSIERSLQLVAEQVVEMAKTMRAGKRSAA